MSKTAAFPTVECTVELPLSWQNIGIAGMPANLAISGALLIYACAWPVAVFLFCMFQKFRCGIEWNEGYHFE